MSTQTEDTRQIGGHPLPDDVKVREQGSVRANIGWSWRLR